MMTESYKTLLMWKQSTELAVMANTVARKLSEENNNVLSEKISHTSISIPLFIADGYHGRTKNDYLQGLIKAWNSVYKLEAQLSLCVCMGYFEESELKDTFALVQTVLNLLNKIIDKLQKT